jgi:hypothetical protein
MEWGQTVVFFSLASDLVLDLLVHDFFVRLNAQALFL